MILSPIAGIYIYLQAFLNQMKEEKIKFVQLEEFIAKGDGYESALVKNFVGVLKADSQTMSEFNKCRLALLFPVIGNLDYFVEKHYSPVFSNQLFAF